MNKRRFGKVCAAALVAPLVLAAPAWGDTYPSKPIRFIMPFAAGGPTDVLSRAYANQMSQLLGQPVIVDNKPGAGGNLGVDLIAKAQPDG